MAQNEAILEVLRAEKEGQLWTRRLLGFPVWSLERFRRYRHEVLAFSPEAISASTQPSGLNRVKKEWRLFRASLKDLRSGGISRRTTEGRDIWVLSNSRYRKPDEHGVSRCTLTEHLRAQLGSRLLFIEFNSAGIPSQNRPDLCFIDALQLPALVGARLCAPWVALWLRVFRKDFCDAFLPTPARRLADRAIYGRLLLTLSRRWMQKSCPRAVFVICGYNMHTPIQLAARELGIPVIELQHGLISENHSGYVFDGLDDRPLPVPDNLIVFGSYWGKLLERESPYWRNRWIAGGHPWLKRQAEAAHPRKRGTGPRLVVLFGQYEVDTRTRIRTLARDLAERLSKDWQVVIKPHPLEPDCSRFYHSATEAGAELAGPDADPYVMLAQADVTATEYSTIALEALAFPCTSVLLTSDKWTDVLRQGVEEGLLHAAEGVDDLLRVCGKKQDPEGRENLASDLFGVGQPAPDFKAFIEACRLATSKEGMTDS